MDFESIPSGSLPPMERSGRWIVLWALICGLVGLLSLAISDARPGQVIIWLANPVGTVALLRLRPQRWPLMMGALLLSLWGAHAAYMWLSESSSGTNADPISVLWRTGLEAPVLVLEMLLSTMLIGRISQLHHAGDRAPVQALVLVRGALFPAAVLAPLGGAVWTTTLGGEWQALTLNWFIGHTIGTLAALPLALAVSTKRPRVAIGQLTDPLAVVMLLGSLSVTLWAAVSLPQPFVFMVTPMVLMAARISLVATFSANVLIAASMAALIRHGVLLPPPSSNWWGDALFYLSVLATLLPGLFLAVLSEGQRLATQVLADSELHAKALYFQTPAMLHSINADGRIVQVNKLWLDTLGYAERDVLGRYVTEFMTHSSALYAKEVVIPAAVRDGRADNIEYQLLRRDGSLCDVILSAIWEYDSAGQPTRSLAVLQDVTEKKRLEARSHFAEHDPLTGLPNRVLLQDRLKMLCAHHGRHGGSFAVGFLDLDHFKEINDNHGHDAGDVLLKEVAGRLKNSLRAADTVCRVGGDEFVMLFSALEVDQELQALANKVMQAVAVPCKLGDTTESPVVEVSGSLGLAVFPADGSDPQTLLTHADQAMYSAKRSGRNRSALYRANVDGIS